MALKDQLVAYWDYEQDPVLGGLFFDQTHNSNHMRAFNDPVLAEGRVGQAVLLDDGSQVMDVASYAGISHQGQEFTVGFWYKPITLSAGSPLIAGNEWSIAISFNSPDYFLSVTIAGKTMPITSVPLIVGEWYFVALGWREGIGLASLWTSINLSNGEHTLQPSISPSISAFLVGGGGVSAMFDEFAIWRRALSDFELSTIYNNGEGITYDDYDEVMPCRTINCCD